MTETNNTDDIDYGPLGILIGVWQGDKGMDVAPEPDGSEHNPYYETITFQAAGDVSNAESQCLVAVHYRQVVSRKSNQQVFHDETGYWMWDAETGVIMHSLTIPRAVSVLAGGTVSSSWKPGDEVVLEVHAGLDDPDWGILQSPFMRDNARTLEFHYKASCYNDTLSYKETTVVDIYGRRFEHSDENVLIRHVDIR